MVAEMTLLLDLVFLSCKSLVSCFLAFSLPLYLTFFQTDCFHDIRNANYTKGIIISPVSVIILYTVIQIL